MMKEEKENQPRPQQLAEEDTAQLHRDTKDHSEGIVENCLSKVVAVVQVSALLVVVALISSLPLNAFLVSLNNQPTTLRHCKHVMETTTGQSIRRLQCQRWD